jgi:hypothetical protein
MRWARRLGLIVIIDEESDAGFRGGDLIESGSRSNASDQ